MVDLLLIVVLWKGHKALLTVPLRINRIFETILPTYPIDNCSIKAQDAFSSFFRENLEVTDFKAHTLRTVIMTSQIFG